MIDAHHGWNRSLKPVILGYILSLIAIFAAYRVVVHSHLTNIHLVVTVIGLGCIQALLQLIFYMHLGLESKPRWNMMMFLFTAFVIFLIVGGSIWIMSNLDYNAMPKFK